LIEEGEEKIISPLPPSSFVSIKEKRREGTKLREVTPFPFFTSKKQSPIEKAVLSRAPFLAEAKKRIARGRFKGFLILFEFYMEFKNVG
jgi:hypothetical protein